jgi:RNA polymerase sigma-70 factor (ECF subfamily)
MWNFLYSGKESRFEGDMRADGAETDDELLQRIQSGDEGAFLALYHRRQAALCRFALHMSGSLSVAEDVTQEVFLTLLRQDCGYDPTRGTLSGYLFGIARKLVLRHLERGRSDVALETDGDEGNLAELAVSDDPLLDLTRREGIEMLRRAVHALPRRYREVVVLCDLEEVDYADAAAALGCPIGTVRSRLHRARGLLLEKLTQERSPRQALNGWKPVRCLT